jgi:hypothetical protein
VLCISCTDGDVYTLYRSSVVVDDMRVHVATFDSKDGEAYNHENCQLAQDLFQRQDGVQTKFWCEKGKFRK